MERHTTMANTLAESQAQVAGRWRIWLYSGIGIFFFFVPITIGEKSTIPLDHLVTGFRTLLGPITPYVILLIVVAGAIVPFITGGWKSSRTQIVFSLLGLLGLVVTTMVVFGWGPSWILNEDIAPFLYNSVATSVGLLVPIGAIFLALLIGYGLMEFIGVLVQPVMRPVWRTPGRSAVDAVASFVGSYSLGLLITDKMYQSGKYTGREAAIIAVGFSTVSVTFMVVVANTLGLMDLWLTYFFLTFIVTFVVSAIVVRLPPLRKMPETIYEGATAEPEVPVRSGRLKVAWKDAQATLADAPSLPVNLWQNFYTGLKMSMAILPSIMSVGTIALLLAYYTPIFDYLAFIFWPFMWIIQIADPWLASKAAVISITEMFLPATIVAGHEDLALRLLIGVVSVSAIIFFSALVPCIMATKIPISVWQLVVIWFFRVVLTILIAGPLCHLIVWLM